MPCSLFDSLEPRRLFHSAALIDGLLTIQGSDVVDRFDITVNNGELVLQAYENGVPESPMSFLASSVKSTLIFCEGGGDMVHLNNFTGTSSIDGGKGSDTIIGGLGNDTIKGGASNDSIEGGDGNDVIVGGFGADIMAGNKGRDIVDYNERGGPIIAGLGSNADDGEPGENDTCKTTFEILRGGAGDDTLRTTVSSPVTLIGGAGNDTLSGGGGDDALDGGAGVDLMRGNGGNDSFYAQDGVVERLEGGEGTDIIISRDKKDKLFDIP